MDGLLSACVVVPRADAYAGVLGPPVEVGLYIALRLWQWRREVHPARSPDAEQPGLARSEHATGICALADAERRFGALTRPRAVGKLLPGHGEVEALLRADEVVLVVGAGVELDPGDGAVELVVAWPVVG